MEATQLNLIPKHQSPTDDENRVNPSIMFHTDGQLRVYINNEAIEVQVYQCFPWSKPGHFISLRDMDENEVLLIEKMEDLDPLSRKTIENTLRATGFVMEITALESIEEDFEIRNWQVNTSRGQRKFQTQLDGRLRKLPDNGLLIEDVSGDLFYIKNPDALDKKSKKLLWALVD